MKRLLFLMFLMNSYDAFITLYGVHHCGAKEINPLMRDLVVHNPPMFLLVKHVVFLLVLALLALGLKYTRSYSKRLIYTVFTILFIVCIWNTIQLTI